MLVITKKKEKPLPKNLPLLSLAAMNPNKIAPKNTMWRPDASCFQND